MMLKIQMFNKFDNTVITISKQRKHKALELFTT